MNKSELASYLVSLHTLMEAQSKAAGSIPSTTLAAEYERCWKQLKEKITDEARNGKEHDDRAEVRTETESGVSRRSLTPGDNASSGNNVQTTDLGAGIEGPDGESD